MAQTKLLEEFLSAVRGVHGTSGGTKETSYYTAYWKNIPQPVWDFTIGGYQVIKKWLSYREQRVLGRALTLTQIMEVTAMARRLAALVLLQAQLDQNYQTVAATTWEFGRPTSYLARDV